MKSLGITKGGSQRRSKIKAERWSKVERIGDYKIDGEKGAKWSQILSPLFCSSCLLSLSLLLAFGTNKPEKREGDDYQSGDDACFIFLQALS